MLPLFALLLVNAAPDAGPADAGFDPSDPATWTLSAKLPKGSALRQALVNELTADAGKKNGVGETPLTPDEAEALLDDPRAQLVYGEKTISIVAPSMIKRQRQDHLDLMKRFLAPERIEAGAQFALAHDAVLERVETKTGVDREAIIGILMWETKLGTITGDYQAFNAFISQTFFIDEANALALAQKDEKAQLGTAAQRNRVETIRTRARKNLLALARQCKTRGIDTLTMKGSWAGALGFPQFMPASLQWAEDGNEDHVIDLFDFDDAIASIGRYLAAHGWAADHKKAVWGYNHEDAYVQGVLAFADALKVRLGRADGGVTSPSEKASATSPDAGPNPRR